MTLSGRFGALLTHSGGHRKRQLSATATLRTGLPVPPAVACLPGQRLAALACATARTELGRSNSWRRSSSRRRPDHATQRATAFREGPLGFVNGQDGAKQPELADCGTAVSDSPTAISRQSESPPTAMARSMRGHPRRLGRQLLAGQHQWRANRFDPSRAGNSACAIAGAAPSSSDVMPPSAKASRLPVSR
jgi:hypothetical protein